jgi:protein-S-isoprenylcysteine O-methyltransferase Ste14
MATSVTVISAYFFLWAALHSLLASLWVKRWACRTLGQGTSRWYRLAFNAIAGLTILPWMTLIALLPDRTLYVIQPPFRWVTIGVQALVLGAMLWTLAQTGATHFVGLAQLLADDPNQSGPLQIRGLYCYVRHPLYLFALILLWLTPVMTVSIATANVLITLYFFIGSVFEEKKLLVEFGEAYADYQRRVPRLIPRLRRCYPPTTNDTRTLDEEES